MNRSAHLWGLALLFWLSPSFCFADPDPLFLAGKARTPPELAEAERVLQSQIQDEAELTRRSVMYRTSLAAILDRQDKKREAISMYKEALSLRAQVGGPHLFIERNIARLLEQQDEYELAMDYRKREVRLYGELGDCGNEWAAVLRVGHLFRKSGQLDAALASYDIAESVLRRCESKHPEDSAAVLLASRAEVLRLQGHEHEAELLLKIAAELEARDPIAPTNSPD